MFKQQLPDVDWHKTARLLYHMRLTPSAKSKVWQMITGSLYMGMVAFEYLSAHNKFPQYRDNFQFCPHCAGFIESSYIHQFWDCPHSQKLWGVVANYLRALNIDIPIKSFLDLIRFISHKDNVTLTGVFIYELIYNMFYAIWVTYYDSMCIVNSDQQQCIIERISNIHNITLKHYNHYNYISAKLLPMHNIATGLEALGIRVI